MRTKGWQLVGAVLLNRHRGRKAWNYGNCVSVSPSPSILSHDNRRHPRQGHTRAHRKHFFSHHPTGCFQVTVHLHKRSTSGAFRLHFSVLFEARIPATTLLDGKQFFCIPVLQGSARWWPSEAGNVADDTDLRHVWDYRDFFLRRRHSRWQMVPTTPVKVAARIRFCRVRTCEWQQARRRARALTVRLVYD